MRTRSRRLRFMWDRALGLKAGTLEKILLESECWQQAQRGTISIKKYWDCTGDTLRLDQCALSHLRLDFYQEDMLDLTLIDLIGRLRQRQIAVGLLSNNTTELLTELDALGLHEIFDACVISAQIGHLKPHPITYETILTALRMPPGSALMIDDFAENIAGARHVGMEGIQYSPKDELESYIDSWLAHLQVAAH